MYESDRRKFLRVLFEEGFEVRATEWSDKEATGLDISLNGCRFNCKQSMTDGEMVSIVFKPGLELEGSVRWCWPIEWYFQAALHFEDISQEKQDSLKAYIEVVTGEDYQMQKEEETVIETTVESVEILEEDLDNIDDDLSASIIDQEDQEEVVVNDTEEDELKELLPLEEEDLLNPDIEEPIDSVSNFSDVEKNQEEVIENSAEEDELEELPPLEEEDLLNLDIEEPIDSVSNFSDVEKNQEEVVVNSAEEDELEELLPLEEEDLLNLNIEEPIDSVSVISDTKHEVGTLHELAESEINTLSIAGKQIVLYDLIKDQAEILKKYLTDRAGIKVEYVTKKENLWRLLKIDPMDLVIIETGMGSNSDALEVMQQTKDQFPEVQLICMSGPVSLEKRLQFLNAGALDYLTRPVHLSTIAQSVLVHLKHTVVGDIVEDLGAQGEIITTNKELQEELASMTEQRDEAIADAKANAVERDEAMAETKKLERRSLHLAEEKESLYLDETFIPDEEPIADSSEIDPVEDLRGATSLLDEDLKISEEVDLIEEDY